MQTNFELSRWQETPKGLGYRRWVIVSTGLRQAMRPRFQRILFVLAWAVAAFIATASFVFGESTASGGWIESYAGKFDPHFQQLAAAFSGVLLLYPDICVRGLFTLLFWIQSFTGLWLCLLSLTIVVPRLVTQDRASNALTIYLARPLTSFDYLLGKLGIVAGLVILFWTGPLLAGWLVSMLLSPSRDFFIYSLQPLERALLFNLIALLSLAAISLGVSALGRSSRNTVLLWMGVWIVAGAIASSSHNPNWLRRASFSHDLSQLRQRVLGVDEALAHAAEQLPLLSQSFADTLKRGAADSRATDAGGAATGLVVLVSLSSFVFFRKLRAE